MIAPSRVVRRFAHALLLVALVACDQVSPNSPREESTVADPRTTQPETAAEQLKSLNLEALSSLTLEVTVDDSKALTAQRVPIKHRVVLLNSGQQERVISGIQSSCSCLEAKILIGTAAPGECLEVELSVTAPTSQEKTGFAYIMFAEGVVVTTSIRVLATEYTRAWIGEVEFDAVHATVEVLASRSTSPPLSATARAGESESSQPLWEPVRSADGSMSALWIARVQLPMQNPEDWRIMYGDGLLGIVSTSLREVALPPE